MNVEQVIDSLQHYSFDFAVTDDMVYQFITTPPVSSYFSDLIHNLKEQCTHLDNLVHALEYVPSISQEYYII
jgi:enoyl-[acyl-carrier-protein] reductase (NADH)